MSYVVSIRREEGSGPFSSADLEEASKLPGFSLDGEFLIWTNPTSHHALTMNITPEEIWTDDPVVRSREVIIILRSLAMTLGAGIYGEEGEDLSEAAQAAAAAQPASRSAVALGLAGTVFLAPFVVLLALVRLPWVLWKIMRASK
jgi:hypothetical protein